MKIALLGTRGIPASYGGFETCVEEIGQRLVANGHSVCVYSKKTSYNRKITSYKGMEIIKIPYLAIKGIGKLCYSILSVLHSLLINFDMHMVFGVSNGPVLIFYKLLKKNFALNTDGLEWMRGKWGFFGRNYYKFAEYISVFVCKNLVSDSKYIHHYYKSKYNADSTIITYGANPFQQYIEEDVNYFLKELGIEKKKYLLQVTRFEPENNPLLTLLAFRRLQTDFKYVLIGGVEFPSTYSKKIEKEAESNKKIILPGFIYQKKRLNIIWQNAYCYIHGNSVGGTNPSLLQAISTGRPIIAFDCLFNRSILDGNGCFYDRNVDNLCAQITKVLQKQDEAEDMAQVASERSKALYSWKVTTNAYEALFKKILNSK